MRTEGAQRVDKRLPKVLALLESENDAEALQALRTAQKMLSRTSSSIYQLFELAQAARKNTEGSGRHSPEVASLQEELKRYRNHIEVLSNEKEIQKEEIEQLRTFIRSSGSMNLFDRLRDRERNVAALTREVRRLKDEIFLAERRIRSLEAHRAKGKRKSSDPASNNIEERVRAWLENTSYCSSVNLSDWVSARELYREFMNHYAIELHPQQERTKRPAVQEVLKISFGEFVKVFSTVFGQEPHTPHAPLEPFSVPQRSKGFLIQGRQRKSQAS